MNGSSTSPTSILLLRCDKIHRAFALNRSLYGGLGFGAQGLGEGQSFKGSCEAELSVLALVGATVVLVTVASKIQMF
jgi:hypothetical protein